MAERQAPSRLPNVNGLLVPSPMTPSPEPKWVTPVEDVANDNARKMQYDDHMPTMERVTLCLAELAGTTILVFLGCLGCKAPAEQVSLTFGFAILIAVQAFGHISGAHINPAVTVGALFMGMIPLIQLPIYFFGSIPRWNCRIWFDKDGGSSSFIKPQNNSMPSLCSPDPNPDLSEMQVTVVEFLLTLFLVWTVCAAWDNRNGQKTETISIKLGLVVAGLALAGGSFTGAHMNPARTFGPALLNADWGNHWMYWIGPLVAGAVGGLSYRIIFLKNATSNDAANDIHVTSNDKP